MGGVKLESGFQFGLIWFLMQGVRAYRLISKAKHADTEGARCSSESGRRRASWSWPICSFTSWRCLFCAWRFAWSVHSTHAVTHSRPMIKLHHAVLLSPELACDTRCWHRRKVALSSSAGSFGMGVCSVQCSEITDLKDCSREPKAFLWILSLS